MNKWRYECCWININWERRFSSYFLENLRVRKLKVKINIINYFIRLNKGMDELKIIRREVMRLVVVENVYVD